MTDDPVTRELIRAALVSIADNMVVSVIRTARSIVVKSNLDFSASICDAAGRMVVQGLALPVHLGATMPALAGCRDFFGDDVAPGDILVSNDPYAGASHLNDVFMFKPVFAEGRLFAYLSLILHHTDMGGRVPGGNAADSSEIYQEGLRIPPSKIYERGVPNRTLFRIIENNVRVADRVLGDLRSQIAALHSAERELLKVIAEHPLDMLRAQMDGLVDHAERLTRAGIAALPDGTAEFDEWNDDDGAGGGPVKIHVKLTIKGDEAVIDFTGTSPQSSGALNPNFWFTASCSYAALRAVLPLGIPNNAGFYKPITVIAPERSFVNPVFPAPVGARGQAGYRVRSAVLGALAQLYPDKVPACPGGNEFAIVFAGYEEDHKPFLMLEFHNMTGMGGGPDADGQDAGPYCLGNVANVPIEIIEAEQPVRIEEYGFLPDTGGPGRYRGALGIVRQYRLLAGEATVQLRSDRNVFPPWGLLGGEPGATGRAILNPASNAPEELPSKFVRTYRKGDVIRGEMPGSGGHGDPFQRDPAAVLEDVRQEKMSLAHASDAYGVVVDPDSMTLDVAGTHRLRGERPA